MTKYIEIQVLIPAIAKNLESNFNVEKREITNNIVSLLHGIADQSTIRNHLPPSMKKWKEKTCCGICKKRINANPHSIYMHMKLKHGTQATKPKPIEKGV